MSGLRRGLDMKRRLIKLIADVRGATALEYGLIVALIVIAIVIAISNVGGGTSGIWGNMTNKVSNAMPVS
jgi:pilus assembly protein Flp/PilA